MTAKPDKPMNRHPDAETGTGGPPTQDGGDGVAALSICEALALALVEEEVLDVEALQGLLDDAAAAQRDAAQRRPGDPMARRAASLIEGVCQGLTAARRRRGADDGA